MFSGFRSYRIVNGKPISDEAFAELAANAELVSAVWSQEPGAKGTRGPAAAPKAAKKWLAAAALPAGPEDVVGLTPIKIGEPIHLFLRELYLGKNPSLGLFQSKKRMIVTSTVKNLPLSARGARAVHVIKSVAKGERIRVNVGEGSPILYYQKALMSLNVGVEIGVSFDDHDDDLYQELSKLLAGAAAVPVFATAAPYLITASGLVSIASKIAETISDSDADISFAGTEYSMGFAGSPKVEASFRVVCRPQDQKELFREHELDAKTGTVTRAGDASRLYDGPIPYAVVALDSKDADVLDLSGYEPLLATADLLKGVESDKSVGQGVFEQILSLVKLGNDVRYGDKAKEYARLADAATDPDRKASYEKLRDAAYKNILDEERRKLFGGT